MRSLVVTSVLFLLAGCAGGLSGLMPGLDERVDKAPLSAESRSALQSYFNKPNPKAFVFSAETGKNWHAWGAGSVEEAEAISLSKCEELTGTRCVVFARNNDIVWQDPAAAPSDVAAATQPTHVVRSAVNMRSGPGTGHPVVTVLQPGERLESLGQDGVWRMVKTPSGAIGYVHGDYLAPAPLTSPAARATKMDRAALATLMEAAENGDTAKQYDLGNRYMHGFGVERDVVEARLWYERAAAGGHPVAAYELGLIYEKGEGVAVDRAAALRWYRIGAAAGHQPSRERAALLEASG